MANAANAYSVYFDTQSATALTGPFVVGDICIVAGAASGAVTFDFGLATSQLTFQLTTTFQSITVGFNRSVDSIAASALPAGAFATFVLK